MFGFPLNLPAALKDVLERSLTEPSSFQEGLTIAGQAIGRYLDARFCVAVCEVITESLRKSQYFVCEPTAERSTVLQAQTLATLWKDQNIGFYLNRDMDGCYAPRSFSPFSWTYPRGLLGPDRDGKSEGIPFSFTLVVPFSSKLVVKLDQDKRFYGHLALCFDNFPKIDEERVQFIGALSEFASELVTTVLREFQGRKADLGIFAHNVKHYLMVNQELLRKLQTVLGSDDKAPPVAAKLERQLKHMMHETNAVLLTDKDDMGDLDIVPMEISLNELVQDAVTELAQVFKSAHVTVECDLEADLPLSFLDPSLFPSAINNLLDNALKYSGAGSVITLRTRKTDDKSVRLEVSDNGIGIPEDERPYVFRRYYRARNAMGKSGNGLGLYLVKRIVEAHFGEVFLSVEPEQRTKFVVQLPIITARGKTEEAVQ